jgi:hypothetical protein
MAVAVMARALSCRRLPRVPGARIAVDEFVLLFMGAAVVVMASGGSFASVTAARIESRVVHGDEVGDREPFLVQRNVGTSHHEDMIDF